MPAPTFILCFDFDGTFISQGTAPAFHPRALEYIRALQQAGAAWVINSGRGLDNLIRGLGEGGVFALPDFIVANEYEIYRPGVAGGWDAFGPWNKQVDRDQRSFSRQHQRPLSRFQGWIRSSAQADMLQDERGNWGIVAETIDEMSRICDELQSLQAEHPDLGYQRNGRHLRFSHSAYNKGNALAELGRLLGIEADRIFAAGDNHNDLPMLSPEIARFRACPANAEEPIKEHLRETSGYVASQESTLGMMEAMLSLIHI